MPESHTRSASNRSYPHKYGGSAGSASTANRPRSKKRTPPLQSQRLQKVDEVAATPEKKSSWNPFMGECGCYGGCKEGLLPRMLETGKQPEGKSCYIGTFHFNNELQDGKGAPGGAPSEPAVGSSFTAVTPTKPGAATNAEDVSPIDSNSPRSGGEGSGSSGSEQLELHDGQYSKGRTSSIDLKDLKGMQINVNDIMQLGESAASPPLSTYGYKRSVLDSRPEASEVAFVPRPESQTSQVGPLASLLGSAFGGGAKSWIGNRLSTVASVRESLLSEGQATHQRKHLLQSTVAPSVAPSLAPTHCHLPKLSADQKALAEQYMKKVKLMDSTTHTPFILVEIRGNGSGNGSVEISGKDEFAVYESLHGWLSNFLNCRKMDNMIDEDMGLSFCDARYEWDGFREMANGLNNIGLVTMQLIEFMCGELSWTLGMVNGGNLGTHGEIREQRVIFKAPHPMNLVVPHMMMEMRSDGTFQMTSSDSKSMDIIERMLVANYSAQRTEELKGFCDRGYKVRDNVFLERGAHGENNLGLLTVRMCDFVAQSLAGWSLVAISGGNFGEDGMVREQQLFFRRDQHPQGDSPHLMVELREVGFIEFSGDNVDNIHEKLEDWLSKKWGCFIPDEAEKRAMKKRMSKKTLTQDREERFEGEAQDNRRGSEGDLDMVINAASMSATGLYYNKKLVWSSRDLHVAAADLTGFFHELGWQMVVCNTGVVDVDDQKDCREQQLIFRPLGSQLGVVEPHLFVGFKLGDVEESLDFDSVQIPKNQSIRVRAVGDCMQSVRKAGQLIQWLGGTHHVDDGLNQEFSIDLFMFQGLTGGNFGGMIMRMSDLIVSSLGWSFVMCNVVNLGKYGQRRELQLVFRYDGERIDLPAPAKIGTETTVQDKRRYANFSFPKYWRSPEVLQLERMFSIVPCEGAETASIQEIFDATFTQMKNGPIGLNVVQAFRCEHLELTKHYNDRKEEFKGEKSFATQTQHIGGVLNNRLSPGEAFLLHGSAPSNAMSILKSGFVLGTVGKAAGITYGSGIYLAESASYCDMNSCDDKGGNYVGLHAILLCRCLVGKPMVVHDSGDHVTTARMRNFDSVVGNAKQKVGKVREFVFWDDAQVLPEYAVIYKRRYEMNPDGSMRKASSKDVDEHRCCCKMQ